MVQYKRSSESASEIGEYLCWHKSSAFSRSLWIVPIGKYYMFLLGN